MALLEVENLTVKFYTSEGVVTAVDGLSYTIDRGEKFGVVGESGAGKSVTALSLLRLIESPGEIESGSIRFADPDTVTRLEESYPGHVVDVEDLRDEYNREKLVSRFEEADIPATELTDNPRHDDVEDVLAAGKLDVRDLIDRGHATDLGLIDEEAFIVYDGDEQYIDLLRAPEEAVRTLRGNNVSMIFQDAQTALNPVYTVGEQIAEAIRHHLDYDDEEAKQRAIELLDRVGIPDAESRYTDYPHEFSGGMQQRAVIAMALSCDPDVIIADEPTTALDVTTEAKILDLLEELTDEFDTAVQLITHDLGVVAELCDRVMVMYAGQPVEKAPVEELYYDPKHPYTVGLMSSIPRIGDDRERLQTIPGAMPDLIETPSGCSFHPRCPYAEEACKQKEPRMVEFDSESVDRSAKCLEYTDDLDEGVGYTVTVEDERRMNEPVSGDQHE
ncbi:ABC transporter ATP-binding protein [Natronobacterium gregoryi]|uniref:Nickel import system ATP-binding protein NikD n=2 Tax=Natronobacterium gregoryi TaxID=44930 RepID=L0ADW4_NATGS|nr:ABC transporter ATP-binding protein [Natronobacterium gregoryi]AFZ72041.1 oligopeptide/dipeptide ABC transporter, ATP-binding protein [Natronobacterium gregoryi SP2]ELY62683.1 peptide ABC transporter ATPase [Natronobacterium gregoryi SP2]PLK20890.1 ABC transporter ATP-binding protein [Natronobacterium gregoryi SP2]SFJ20508.1 peptide/nickel transport system ATP-binding protein [Natronobacterium gregoryi]